MIKLKLFILFFATALTLSAQNDPFIVFGYVSGGADSIVMNKLEDNYAVPATLFSIPDNFPSTLTSVDRRLLRDSLIYCNTYNAARKFGIRYFVIEKTDTVRFDTVEKSISAKDDGQDFYHDCSNPTVNVSSYFIENRPNHRYSDWEKVQLKTILKSEGKLMLKQQIPPCWRKAVHESSFSFDSIDRLVSARLLRYGLLKNSMFYTDVSFQDSAGFRIVESYTYSIKNDSCMINAYQRMMFNPHQRIVERNHIQYYDKRILHELTRICYDSMDNLIKYDESFDGKTMNKVFRSNILYRKSGKIQSRWDTLYTNKNGMDAIDKYARFDFDEKQQLIKADYGGSYNCYYYLPDGRSDRTEFFYKEKDSSILGYSYVCHYRPDKRLDSLCYTFSGIKSFRLENESPFDHSVRIVKRKDYPFFKIRYDEQGRVIDYQFSRLQQSLYSAKDEFEVNNWPRFSFTYDKKGLPEFCTYKIVYRE